MGVRGREDAATWHVVVINLRRSPPPTRASPSRWRAAGKITAAGNGISLSSAGTSPAGRYCHWQPSFDRPTGARRSRAGCSKIVVAWGRESAEFWTKLAALAIPTKRMAFSERSFTF